MEYIFSCEICSEDYNSTSVIPTVLNCGHTFCSSCIAKLSDYICPKCRAHIDKEMEFPVNYSILNIIDECKSGKNLIPDIVCRIQDLRKKVNTRFTTIKSEISNKTKQIKIVGNDLNTLKLLETKDLTQESGRSEVRKHLNEMEKRYEVSSLDNPNGINNTNMDSNFSLKKSRSHDAFLKEVYQALKKFEKVFTFKHVETNLKFGELTVRDNLIFIHSLSSDEPPNGSKTVLFDDLKEASRKKNFHTFIEVTGKNGTSRMVIIDLEDDKLCPHFIKLCTGENGPSYRNCSYSTETRSARYEPKNIYWSPSVTPKRKKQNDQIIVSALCVDISKGLPLDYYKNVPSNMNYIRNDVVLKERPNDGFELREVSEVNYDPTDLLILGKVIYPKDILSYVNDDKSSSCKILDCGIAIGL